MLTYIFYIHLKLQFLWKFFIFLNILNYLRKILYFHNKILILFSYFFVILQQLIWNLFSEELILLFFKIYICVISKITIIILKLLPLLFNFLG